MINPSPLTPLRDDMLFDACIAAVRAAGKYLVSNGRQTALSADIPAGYHALAAGQTRHTKLEATPCAA